jgi:hypothetical protein
MIGVLAWGARSATYGSLTASADAFLESVSAGTVDEVGWPKLVRARVPFTVHLRLYLLVNGDRGSRIALCSRLLLCVQEYQHSISRA